jgi:hypothetical protein
MQKTDSARERESPAVENFPWEKFLKCMFFTVRILEEKSSVVFVYLSFGSSILPLPPRRRRRGSEGHLLARFMGF